jgi:hypothetical protein
MNLDERIAKLDDQQALSIVDSLAGEFARDDMPEGRSEQASALTTLLRSQAQPVDPLAVLQADGQRAAEAARELLKMMAEVPEMRASVVTWLDHPPVQETAAIPLVLAAPIVLTACIALLTVVGNISFRRSKDGKWEVTYDPSKASPMNKSMVAIARILAGGTHGGKDS